MTDVPFKLVGTSFTDLFESMLFTEVTRLKKTREYYLEVERHLNTLKQNASSG